MLIRWCVATVWIIASHLDMKNDSVWKIIFEDLGMSENKQDLVR